MVPAFQRYTTHQQAGQQIGAGRNHQVCKSIAALQRKHTHLTGDTKHISQRCHHRHNHSCLAGAGGNKEVDQRIDDEHADGRSTLGHRGQWQGEIIHHGVKNFCFVQDNADKAGENHENHDGNHFL